jgi:RND family efflux transporter MFP subunit
VNIALRFLIPLLLIAVGYGGMKILGTKVEETAPPRSFERELPKADVIELRRSSFAASIDSQGVVRAHNSTPLTSRVSGRVQLINPRFEDGGFFKKGDILLELDPSDFEASLASAEARLARATAAHAQEVARAQQALLDWQDLGYTEPPSDLVLRKPQLKEAEANVKSGQADLLQAQRDLERARVLAPYDGCVLKRNVGPGQSITPGTPLGEIFSTDFAEVRLPLAAGDYPFVNLPGESNKESVPVVLSDALSTENGHQWQARIVRSEGVLDETSRELFVIARIDDPYGIVSDGPRLRVGQPVRAHIEGKVLDNVYVLPRKSLRSPTEVLLVNPEDDTIQRTNIDPIWSDVDEVVVRHDLPAGWLLVTSRLPYAANGAKVEPVLPEDDAPKAVQRPEDEPDA